MDGNGAKSITVYQHQDADGRRTLFLAEPWPARTAISTHLLSDGDPAFIKAEDNLIHLALKNATATYRKITEEFGYWECELERATYAAMPKVAA